MFARPSNEELEFTNFFCHAVVGTWPLRPVVKVECIRQGWGTPQVGTAISGRKMCLNGNKFDFGIGTHADSELRIRSTVPLKRFTAKVGVDDFYETRQRDHCAVFSVEVAGREVWTSREQRVGDEPATVDVDLNSAREFILKAREIKGLFHWGHLDWADARIITSDRTEIAFGTDRDSGFFLDVPPFSFNYDGRASADLLKAWPHTVTQKKTDDQTIIHRWTAKDPATGLECVFELKQFPDFPAVEWVVRFKNTGTRNTPILADIQALDLPWFGFSKPVLYHSKGSGAQIDDFLYGRQPINPGAPVRKVTSDGRSSSVNCLPFFNLAKKDEGAIVAIGWTGQWAAEFATDNYITTLRAGMEKTHLVLHPGEEIRTPSIVMVFWKGDDPLRGHNLLRRLILARYTYCPDGKTIPAPVCIPHWGGLKTADQLERVEFYEKMKLDYDYFWIDAAWYGPEGDYCPDVYTGNWASNVGWWDPNPTAHPKGLRPIADAVHAKGKKFLLWFEPERAFEGTPWIKAHPEWFLREKNGNPNWSIALFNLGLADARKWFINELSRRIKDWGIDCYRQDFNMAPLNFWREADAPDRQGMTEIRYIEGLYQVWDELLRRHPGLMIDNCASGGRRIDIETTRRSIPLWRSDYSGGETTEPTGTQIQTYGLAHWVPCSTTGTGVRPHDTYNFRSVFCTGVAFSMYDCEYLHLKPDDPHDWHRAMIAQTRRAIPFFLGDYYPLKECTVSLSDWTAYQFHREDQNAGMIVLFRREQSPFPTAVFDLKALEETSAYAFEDVDSGTVHRHTGADLKTGGWTVTINKKRDSRLIFYRKV